MKNLPHYINSFLLVILLAVAVYDHRPVKEAEQTSKTEPTKELLSVNPKKVIALEKENAKLKKKLRTEEKACTSMLQTEVHLREQIVKEKTDSIELLLLRCDNLLKMPPKTRYQLLKEAHNKEFEQGTIAN